MGKSIRARFELVTEKEAAAICRKDARILSSDPDKFVRGNLLGYYVLANCWLAQIEQVSPNGWAYVRQAMLDSGMVAFIAECDKTAKELISGSYLSFSLARLIFMDVESSLPLTGRQVDEGKHLLDDPMACMLQLMRFGKRFSPLYADKLQDASLDAFLETQGRLKHRLHEPFCIDCISLVRKEIHSAIKWKRIIKEIRRMRPEDFSLSSGVTFETRRDSVSKLQFIARSRPEWFLQPFGIPLVAFSSYDDLGTYGDGYDVRVVEPIAVPKNYKTARIIAPEGILRQAKARWIFNVLDQYCPREIDLHDQTRNQEFAREGSISGDYATIDLHAASDSITWPLLTSVFPAEFCRLVEPLFPTHFMFRGKRRMLQTATPMGNSLTFWIESVLFLGISRAAIKFYNRLTGDTRDFVSVYGDDIIVPTDAAPTVIDFLDHLGFIVNDDKSFYSREMKYRESCGEEYLDGLCLSSTYFPRFPIKGTLGGQLDPTHRVDGYTGSVDTSMTALLDLQHKMFLTCDRASRIVTEIILEAFPKMTMSTPDEGYKDIWSYESRPVEKLPPLGWRFSEDEIQVLKDIGAMRLCHMTPSLRKTAKSSESKKSTIPYELFKYCNFLRSGPRFADALSELLRVSEPPLSFTEACGDVELAWVLND